MQTLANFEEVAKSWIDTPYHHQARKKGVGVDCCNLIAAIGEEMGYVKDIKIAPYNLEWHLHAREEKMLDIIESYGFVLIEKQDLDLLPIGTILTFKFGRTHSHMGLLLSNQTIIHASIEYKKVVHTHFDDNLYNRLGYLYTYPGVL